MTLLCPFKQFFTKDLLFCQRYRFVCSIGFKPTRWLIPPVSVSHMQSRSYVHLLNDDDISNVSISEIKRSIKSHYDSFSEGNACLSIECPSCKEKKQANKEVGKLCINFKTGINLTNLSKTHIK